MKTSSPFAEQIGYLYPNLMDQLNAKDPLLALSKKIPWRKLENELEDLYSSKGRPAKPIRLMAGLLLLKNLCNLSDERVVEQWRQNPYYQSFCGETEFQLTLPCVAEDLCYFRSRLGEKGVEKLFSMTVGLHGEAAEEKEVNVDTTVQEKNITYPTDGKHAIKIINRCNKLAKEHGVKQRRTYVKKVKDLRLKLRFFRHPKRRKEASRAMKKLRSIAGTLLRELERKLPSHVLSSERGNFRIYEKALNQKKGDKNKIYSIHEPHVY